MVRFRHDRPRYRHIIADQRRDMACHLAMELIMDPRLIALESNPAYWRGRASVRNDFARELARRGAADSGSDEVAAEYRRATEYERRAEQ